MFASEYVVASKRFGPIDTSLGLAWGYMGNRGDIGNPLSFISDKFSTRPGRDRNEAVGNLSGKAYFRGRPAFFGGLSYQTPWQPLLLKVEYEGNDYRHEPQNNNQKQHSPVNLGAVYRVNRSIDLSLALERGSTAMFGFTLHTNLADHAEPAKLFDPAPLPAKATATQTPEHVDWRATSKELQENAGLRVSKVSRRGREVMITAEQTRYLHAAKGVGRAARVLDNRLGPEIDWYTVVSTSAGLPIVSTSVHRQRFDELLDHRIDLHDFRRSVEQDAPRPLREDVLYRAPLQKFDGGLSVRYSQSIGGPDAFILYQFSADYDADYRFTPNLWWSGNVSANLFNNYNQFKYDAPSELPRVRTYVREYLTDSRITLPVFQLTASKRLGNDLYGLAYAGMLESMYGGVGGEVLYRPMGERWAIGADANWVKQRGFGQDFSFRSYHVATGHVTGYFNTGVRDITLSLSVGRYLAGDWGSTIDVSREFRNGVRMGAYATFTNVSAQRFGEGSFDKGIYLSIPFDLMLQRSTIDRASILWQPLIRDGGAKLGKRYTLYSLTNDRDSDDFNDNLQKITE